MRPMLATPTATPGVPPAGAAWLHEVKWDGVRVLADSSAGKGTRLFNRSGADITVTYPDLVCDLPDLMVDGEVVVLDAAGRPSFQTLSHRFHVSEAGKARRMADATPATYMVFDLLRLEGVSLLDQHFERRRELLDELDLAHLTAGAERPWQASPVHSDGEALAIATREAGLEGVVSKRRSSPYRPGGRTDEWIKTPHRTEIVAVVGGWVEDRVSPGHLGALWVGHPADEATFDQTGILYPIGRAGSGLAHAERDALVEILRDIARPTCPFNPPPPERAAADRARTHWVEPLLCVQVRFLGRTDGGLLRQPVLRFLRPDVTPLQAPDAALR